MFFLNRSLFFEDTNAFTLVSANLLAWSPPPRMHEPANIVNIVKADCFFLDYQRLFSNCYVMYVGENSIIYLGRIFAENRQILRRVQGIGRVFIEVQLHSMHVIA